jgi:DNA-binding transcriptional ArsR family regulator
MTQRATMSQVKFKVRYNALVLREFKVSDIVEATGLKPESVRTELQRMKAEGLLTAGPDGEHTGRGAPPAVYRLTDDPERRLALSESVAAFYPAPPTVDRPSSGAYRRAQQLLDRALNAKGRERKQLLAVAERALAHAAEAEGGEWASEPVKAYLRYECARLRYLQSDYAEAKSEFAALRPVFATLGDDGQAQRAGEFEVCADVGARFGTGSVLNKGAWARYLVHLTNNKNYHTDSPLTVLLLQMVSRLS